MPTAEITLWNRTIGAVSLEGEDSTASFQYTPEFAESGIQIAPVTMPLRDRPYQFADLNKRTYHGLPGLLADSLPDRFGNSIINTWLARQGRTADSFTAVERLCYTGTRGMGALEFHPTTGPDPAKATDVQIDQLVSLASEVLRERDQLHGSFDDPQKADALRDILRVGTSAGGARAKAVIAWNPMTNEVRSGQVEADVDFEYWLLKFDGVDGNKDKEVADPQGYGVIEFAYSQMAKDAGLTMSDCRLFEEGGRRHFMTRRFDRRRGGEKRHMQSLCAIAHQDFNIAGAHSYEGALLIARQLKLPTKAIEQLFRRMVFNIVSRNQDDHTKNIAFLMDKQGVWSLSPAYDVTFSYNPQGDWTSTHQMSLNGKRDHFEFADFQSCAKAALMKRGRAETILKEVTEAVCQWPTHADRAAVLPEQRDFISQSHRLKILENG